MKKRRERKESQGNPAITIQIQSWATPIVGIVLLVIGLFGGYYGRPIFDDTQEALEVIPPTAAAVQPSVDNEDAMAYLLTQIRHFRGNPNAPVTLVEFGDFQ